MASEARFRPGLQTQTPGLTADKSGCSTTEKVTARIVRTDGGEIFTEYQVGGLTFDSLDAMAVVLDGR